MSKRSSLLLFSREVRADPIPVEAANPSSYRGVHPGLLLLIVPQCPTTFSLTENSLFLSPSHLHGVPHSPSASSRNFKQISIEIQTSNVVPLTSQLSVLLMYFFQCSGLGDLMLDNLWSRLALPQRKTHLKLLLECQQPRSCSAGSFVWMGPPENQKIHTKII